VFDDHPSAPSALDIPKLVSDWVCGKDAMNEVARRVVTALRRHNSLLDELGLGLLTLNLESRRLIYLGDVIQLSPAEVPLAELFISHMGSVVPIDEVLLMFKLAGRASTGSNIRVTIFQLRFKIELVSRNQLTITCAYGEGYALSLAKVRPVYRNTWRHGKPWRPTTTERLLDIDAGCAPASTVGSLGKIF
jgi:DNA-binding winged helix-turn-helix (wHTH) protein